MGMFMLSPLLPVLIIKARPVFELGTPKPASHYDGAATRLYDPPQRHALPNLSLAHSLSPSTDQSIAYGVSLRMASASRS
ncbi:conserved hypothetical protein [Ricinus communis]|uniref:Uncharacterized protein n=1 Tax=Ricinus communis TaxID=3988 RepID=B9SHM1_RICCO|nr:conserved hypothetical protein [Ricinus communis]